MKKLFQSLLGIAVLAVMVGSAFGQSAPQYNYLVVPLPWGFSTVGTNTTVYSSGLTNGTSFNTTNAAGVVTTNFYYTSIRNFEEVSVDVAFNMDKANSTGTANTSTFQYAVATGTTNFDSIGNPNGIYKFVVAHNGTNMVYFHTNLYVGSAGFFSGATVVNANTNAGMLNFTNILSFKGNRFGQK